MSLSVKKSLTERIKTSLLGLYYKSSQGIRIEVRRPIYNSNFQCPHQIHLYAISEASFQSSGYLLQGSLYLKSF